MDLILQRSACVAGCRCHCARIELAGAEAPVTGHGRLTKKTCWRCGGRGWI